ncbi:murein biosynthesis integral membrane protein MurJ [Microbulbifer rhizosphaerae]|uniref:Probable lipid II flippase MurJ n=1 Tax=Microbulbifer rhizosphaerae TaxID=1562603 RepID=A0A7W4WG67_9GAMM|nr:murein biosynthesis integral membrane protein MurJ [Microbulbifer rhizosphaerae]MBB3063036.1 putative peptidoglycan lipid II flippase [Microbulbifer rhizosphaerae]
MSQPPDTPQKPSEKSGAARLLHGSSIVGGATFLSRIAGLARDIVVARFVGASDAADAFIVAFKIPNFFRRLFAEGAFAQAFVPVLAEYRKRGGIAAARELNDRVAGALGGSLLMVTLFAVVCAPLVTGLFAFGWWWHGSEQEKFALATEMLRITFPYLMLISLTGFAGAVLNSFDRFAVPALTPVLLNLVLIAAATVAAGWFEPAVLALAWGVFAAGVVQLLFQVPFLVRQGLLPRPRWDWEYPGVRKILRLMAPAIFGVSVTQISLLLDTFLASFLPSGSVSWLYYSDRLTELPLGVFGVAVATVILPSLSRQHADGDPRRFRHTLDWALRSVTLISLPAAVALIVLAEPLLTTLFLHGDEMTVRDMQMAAWSLRAYSLGLLAFMLIKVLAPGYFARQNTYTPVRFGLIAISAKMVLSLALVIPLNYYFRLGHMGLALATAAQAAINAWLLYKGLRRDDVYRPEAGWGRYLLRLLLANLAMVALLLVALHYWPEWSDWSWWQRAWRMGLLVAAGAGTYVLVLLASGLRPRHFRATS